MLVAVDSTDIMRLLVTSPSYVSKLSALLAKTPVKTIRHYMRLRIIRNWGSELSKPLRDEHFAFYGATLQGQREQKPRWKRAMAQARPRARECARTRARAQK